ncbi:amino acid kinase family protein [Dictyobacter aurantiacus]|uniref:UMP kinase n=1 Tax=Dictyobacter aurantiacus TaxID=1936993 RepID=A0A401ZKX0_9CHLR|nr:UMP kinase [Dictyobacter aurantiacus]GCE07472.1 uridylate kinase [Dictyobacter aurantiacus]
MVNRSYKETYIIKLGGSLIVPPGGIATSYLQRFQQFIRQQVTEHQRRFFIFIGGGQVARQYRDAGQAIVGHELTDDDLDWLGIHATRLNAHLMRTVFRDLAHPVIIKDYSIIQKPEKPVVIAAGWKPGWSTDYPAVILAQDYHVQSIFKLSNTDYVYDKDPRIHQDARPFQHLSWHEYRSMIEETWSPGSHAPFDPIAARLASDLNLKVCYLNGTHLDTLAKALNGEPFIGTTIA